MQACVNALNTLMIKGVNGSHGRIVTLLPEVEYHSRIGFWDLGLWWILSNY
jgi:hypothetical protein